MVRKLSIYLTLAGVLLLAVIASIAGAQDPDPRGGNAVRADGDTGFTYQGRLQNGSVPVNGGCDFQFSLWDEAGSGTPPTGGTQIGATQTMSAINVTDGLFTVQLDFGGDAFTGEARWLEIAVRCPVNNGSYTTLSPRQELTAAPYALYAQGAPWSGLYDVPPGFADGVDDVTAVVSGTNIFAGEGLTLASGANTVTMSVLYAGSGGEYGTAVSAARSDHIHDSRYYTQGQLNTAGGGGQVHWDNLTGIPGDLADGDDDTLYSAGTGLSLTDNVFTLSPTYRLPQTCADGQIAKWNGSAWVCRDDDVGTGGPHDHWGESWNGSGTGLTLSGGDTGLAATGSSYGLRGTVAATSGAAVYGLTTASSGLTYGVRGWSQSTAGFGVHGRASASSGTTYGVYGQSDSSDGRAVFGWATAGGGDTYGVYGRSDSTAGYGVHGYASAASGRTIGVYGVVDSSDLESAGVRGHATATAGYASGVSGSSRATGGIGVLGRATTDSGHSRGVWGISYSIDGYGGYFETVNNTGGRGLYAGGARNDPDVVLGAANVSDDNGSLYSDPLYTSSDIVVVSNDAIQMELDNDNDESGNLWLLNGANDTVFSVNENGDTWARGTKGAAVTTELYGPRKLYAVESPEVWFEDFGTGQLVGGQATVAIEPVFAQTVNLDAYHVFLTPLGDCPLYVAEKTPASFMVQAMGGQTCSIAFDYRIVAKRLGHETLRLEPVVIDAEEEGSQ